MKRVAFGTSLATAVLLGGLALPLTPASAGAYPTRIKGATSLDWCPGTAAVCSDSQHVESLAAGTRVKLSCWTNGRSGRWYDLAVSDGKTGWVAAGHIKRAPKVHSCSADHAVTAAVWATGPGVWGSKGPNAAGRAAMKRVYQFSDFGPDSDWSGDTKSLACLAYLANGDSYKLPDGNPKPVYDTYKSEGDVHTGTPPTGALVFWNLTNAGENYGQLGISLGNGEAASADGTDTAQEPVTMKSTSGDIGWVLPY